MLEFWSIPGITVAAYLGWRRKPRKLKILFVPSCVNEDAPRLGRFSQGETFGSMMAEYLHRPEEWHHVGRLQNVQTASMMKVISLRWPTHLWAPYFELTCSGGRALKAVDRGKKPRRLCLQVSCLCLQPSVLALLNRLLSAKGYSLDVPPLQVEKERNRGTQSSLWWFFPRRDPQGGLGFQLRPCASGWLAQPVLFHWLVAAVVLRKGTVA